MDLSKHAEAKAQAWQALAQGLAIDTAGAVLAVLSTQLADVRWTKAFWVALVVVLGKTALQTAVAYISRHVLTASGDS